LYVFLYIFVVDITWSYIDVPLAAATTSFIAGKDTRQTLAYGEG
jgi:hypothetical protein